MSTSGDIEEITTRTHEHKNYYGLTIMAYLLPWVEEENILINLDLYKIDNLAPN